MGQNGRCTCIHEDVIRQRARIVVSLVTLTHTMESEMNTKQYRNAFLKSEINRLLEVSRLQLVVDFGNGGDAVAADRSLNRALAYARQLPVNRKHLSLRAHIVQAQEALRHA